MKNILFILHIPPPVHGSSIVGESIKNSMLINNAFECRYINFLVSRTLKETGVPGFLKIVRFVVVWFKLLKELIKKKPDVCYLALTSTGAAFYKDVLLIGLLRSFHVKIIYHLHNKGVKLSQDYKINERLYRFVFRNANVILLSKLLYQDIDSFVPLSRVFICPNGIVDNTSNFTPHLYSIDKPVKIIFLSNLIKSKGAFLLLDACAILKQKKIIFECDFIGAEVDLSVLKFNKKVKKMGLEKQVNYLGEFFGKEKQEVFAKADIFAFPTYYSNECFPLVILEAMSASLPVVSTFEGGIPDIINEGVTGFLVPQKDVKALAEKLEVLINNPDLRQMMGNEGRKRYENDFKLEIFERRLIDILGVI